MLESHERVSQEPLTISDTFSVSSRCVIRREVDSVLICSSNRFERMSLEGFEFIEKNAGSKAAARSGARRRSDARLDKNERRE